MACSTPKIAAQIDYPAEEKLLRIAGIYIDGNEKTRERYILLELTFATGDSLTINQLEEEVSRSHTNLVNTSLFLNHLIRIDWQYISDDDLLVIITLHERWYLWPEPVLQNAERNFNTWMVERDFKKLNYGVDLIKENFRGRNERLTMVLRLGYDEKYEITYNDPFFNRNGNLGFGFGAGFQGNHEVAYQTSENRLQFIRADNYILTRRYAFAQLNFRPSLHHFHTFRLLIMHFNIDDTLTTLNPDFALNKDPELMLGGFRYLFKIDHRDHKAYPLNGYYFDFEYLQYGLAHFHHQKKPIASAKANIRGFWQISPRGYYGTGATLRIASANSQPFLFEQGLGYGREFVRGYEYNVIHGSHFVLFKQNLKYALIPSRSIRLNFMQHEKFREGWFSLFLNIFTDAGYVSGDRNPANNLVNRWIGGTGIGLDLVTYYDKVLRVETSVNDQGKGGVFVHFIAPI